MPSRARTAPPRRRPAAEPPTVPEHVGQPTNGPLTPHDVADLINHGKLTVADGDALIDELDQPRLKHAQPATFAVPVATAVPADTRPAAAMAHLDGAVQRAVAAMTWTTMHDTDGYAIDAPPRRPDGPAGPSASAGGDLVLVRANTRLAVTVVAYMPHHFASTVTKLLDEDLQHLHDAGVDTGPARRAAAPSDEDPDDDLLRRLRSACSDDSAFYDYYDYDGCHGDPDGDEALDDLDPATYARFPLYDEADLFDEDPAEALFIGHGMRW
jgi:hypothetical protein